MKLCELIGILPVGDTSVISVYWMGTGTANVHNIFNDDMSGSDFPAFIQTFGKLEIAELYITRDDAPDAPNVLNIKLRRAIE